MQVVKKTIIGILILIVGLICTGCFEDSVVPSYTGTISGIVMDVQSDSIISHVLVTTNPGGYSTYSDSVGKYTLSNIKPGSYILGFSKVSYCDTTHAPVSVPENASVTGITVKMRHKDTVTSKKYLIASTANAGFKVGNIGVFALPELTAYTNIFTSNLGSDLFVKANNNSLYILQRNEKDNVIKMSGTTITQIPAQILYQTHIGNAVNIHDIAIVNETKAYITQYGSASLVVFNSMTGLLIDTIGLSQFNPAGVSTPKMDRVQVYGNKAYICLEKLTDGFDTTGNSSVVVINTLTDSVEREIILAKKNPQGIYLFKNKLYIACTGTYTGFDGAIEMVNLDSDSSEGVIIDEIVLNGNVSDVILVSETKGYALVGGTDYKNSCIEFNPQTKTIGTKLAFIDDGSGFVYDGTHLYVSDRNATAPGVIVVNPADNSKISGPHDPGLPPKTLAILEVRE